LELDWHISGKDKPLLAQKDKNYVLHSYSVMIKWEKEEVLLPTEPWYGVAKDDPVTCAMYAWDKDLLEKLGYKIQEVGAMSR
jgi:hypothetical protein